MKLLRSAMTPRTLRTPRPIAIEPREHAIDPSSYATPLDAARAAVVEANDAWKATSGDDNLRVDVLTSKTEPPGPDVVRLLESAGLAWTEAVGDDADDNNSAVAFYLTMGNGKLIGAVVARLHDYKDKGTSCDRLRILEVPLLRIFTDLQKKGHGSRLVGLLFDFAQHCGCGLVFVPIAESAVGFWGKMPRVTGVAFDAGPKLGFACAHFSDMYSSTAFESFYQLTAEVVPGRFAMTVHKALAAKKERVEASLHSQFTSAKRASADVRAILRAVGSSRPR